MFRSMKTRIFFIVGIMLLVTLAIAGVSFYGSQARRTVNLRIIDKIALNRRIATVDVLMTADEAEMKKIIDGALAQLPGAMDAELADHPANCPVPVPATYQERRDTIKTLWANALHGMVGELVSMVEGRVQDTARKPAAGSRVSAGKPGTTNAGRLTASAPSSPMDRQPERNVRAVNASRVIPLGEASFRRQCGTLSRKLNEA